ncbi:sulfotransferase family protein [Microbulbifer hainanensis]|uniref:sulfotransferase family protein n=1 Tax=Microbulbifer hainanensis TaxID=2735675 RepID=UPI0018672B32|nr:sulfotransferase [Microbulbifer hainanensis]
MSRSLPDFFIVGAMKSATSSLHEQLAALPGIFMSQPKEPNFFSDDTIFSRGKDWYRDCFAGAAANDLIGESSTHYAKLPDYPNALPRLVESVSEAKIIYVMRHPIERLVSQYIHEWSQNLITDPIDVAIRTHTPLVDYSRYHYQISPYLQTFGASSVLPVFFERLKLSPDTELRRICRFIGLTNQQCEQVQWRQDQAPSNVSSERIRKFPLYQILIEASPMQMIRRKLVPQSVRDAIKRRLTMAQRPEISLQVTTDLECIFDHDLKKLGQLFNVDLNCANYRELVTGKPLDWVNREVIREKVECLGE